MLAESRLKKLEELLAINKKRCDTVMVIEDDYKFQNEKEEDEFIRYMVDSSPAIIPLIEITEESVAKWRQKK